MIYEIRSHQLPSEAKPEGWTSAWGVFQHRLEAESKMIETMGRQVRGDTAGQTLGARWDEWWIEEIDDTALFPVPPEPKPRDRFKATPTKVGEGWPKCHVEIHDGDTKIAEYDRNYAFMSTWEPFRQGDRNYALYSPHYTATSVMDLATGEMIASEEPGGGGFCPVGFYVPDWHDVHGASIMPGTLYWRDSNEWPNGEGGYVWGCVWGDDSSWKVQYLDLSRVSEGVITRDERFGYVELATITADPEDFIKVYGEHRVTFATWQTHKADGTRIGDDE